MPNLIAPGRKGINSSKCNELKQNLRRREVNNLQQTSTCILKYLMKIQESFTINRDANTKGIEQLICRDVPQSKQCIVPTKTMRTIKQQSLNRIFNDITSEIQIQVIRRSSQKYADPHLSKWNACYYQICSSDWAPMRTVNRRFESVIYNQINYKCLQGIITIYYYYILNLLTDHSSPFQLMSTVISENLLFFSMLDSPSLYFFSNSTQTHTMVPLLLPNFVTITSAVFKQMKN